MLPTPRLEKCLEVQKGLAFLKARYNPAVGLLNEAPTVAPHTYWITNDNVLAAYTFEYFNQPEMNGALRKTIEQYGQASNGLLEVLWGEPVEFPPFTAHTEQIAQMGEDKILKELHTSGQLLEDWAQYADMSIWGALNSYRMGRQTEALIIFSNTMALFDGVGFRDKGFNGQYETYKLALALYVGSTIKASMPAANKLHATLKAMQKADGGFFTHYLDQTQPHGDTNTETTSLALLALWEDCR
jgi:hypothetical protein